MTNCLVCQAKSNLYLCTTHVRDLDEKLTALVTGGTNTIVTQQGTVAGGGGWRVEVDHRMPGLLEHLADATVGLAKLGESGPRQRSHDQPMLSGSPKASRLLGDARRNLLIWAQYTGVVVGIKWEPLDMSDLGAAVMWIADHTHQIARNDQAGALYRDIARLVEQIEHAINRPQPPRFCGPCPTDVDNGHAKTCEQRHPHACGTALMAKRDAIEVICPTCKSTHNVEALIRRLLADVDHWRFDRSEIELIMRTLEEPINPRSFRAWRQQGRIKPSGYRTVDGRRITVTKHDDADVPLYRLSEVRKLNAELRRTRHTETVGAR